MGATEAVCQAGTESQTPLSVLYSLALPDSLFKEQPTFHSQPRMPEQVCPVRVS